MLLISLTQPKFLLPSSGTYHPLINDVLHKGIAGSEWVLFEQSSHMAHVEERALYVSTVRAFIEGVEARPSYLSNR